MTKDNSKKRKIFIVDDHPLLRRGLIQLINQEQELVACGEADNAYKAMEAIKGLIPDLAIVDISLQGPNGIELIKDIKTYYPKLPILVLSMHDESLYAERALRAGAKGYIMKQEATEKVIKAIYRILNEGAIYVSDKIVAKMMDKFITAQSTQNSNSPLECLTNRELEIFQLIGQGMGTRQIADNLCLSVRTIETHRANIKKKFNLKNALELVRYAIQVTQNENFSLKMKDEKLS